jgi:acyl-coenzyme A thioesterase PaaI-like protein
VSARGSSTCWRTRRTARDGRGKTDGGELKRLADVVRRLIETTVSVEAPPEVLAAATQDVARVVEELRPHVPPEPPPRYPTDVRVDASASVADVFPYDYVLGELNPLAPPVRVSWEPPKAIGRVRLERPYEGPPGCVHGAAIAAAFDQVFAVANVMSGRAGPTAKLAIHYRRPSPLGADLRFEAWQDRTEGRKIHGAGRLLCGDEVTAEAEALFIMLSDDQVRKLGVG